MTGKYVLENKIAKPEPNTKAWERWMKTANRYVAEDTIGNTTISTVFIGLDHRIPGDLTPLLFETKVFGGSRDGYQARCSTWDDAATQHAGVVARIRADFTKN
ncbi:MAG: hypothetical protein EKK35_14125 [Bradyrhizobiaceae bacterium]|nr:MAG: hypothetical protein EKK35_14125 [Bradyrhizobiaceae bacterium]